MSRLLLTRALQLRTLPLRPVFTCRRVPVRMFASLPASRTDIEDRVLKILKNFERVDKSKVSLKADFIKDLGLDSLDSVELVVAFEDEFGIEIPDNEADQIFSGESAVKFVEAQSKPKQQA